MLAPMTGRVAPHPAPRPVTEGGELDACWQNHAPGSSLISKGSCSMPRKEDIRKGDMMYAIGGPAEIVRKRDAIRKGVFLTSDAPVRRFRLPLDLKEFEESSALA